jgi:hypothetical protein
MNSLLTALFAVSWWVGAMTAPAVPTYVFDHAGNSLILRTTAGTPSVVEPCEKKECRNCGTTPCLGGRIVAGVCENWRKKP